MHDFHVEIYLAHLQELEGIAMYEAMQAQSPNDVWAEECWEA